MSLGEFLNMGGYALYVWASWALALVIMIANYVAPLRRERQLLRQFARRERRRPQ
jgi:heme exporter protein D